MAASRPPAGRSSLRFIELSILQASAHFLMIRTDTRLTLALALSLAVHLLPVLPSLLAERPAAPVVPPPLQASLRPPPVAAPPLIMPETEPPRPAVRQAPPVVAKTGPASRPRSWQEEVRRQFGQQQQRGDFYPAEAIARGLQGEVVVLLLLGPDGSVVAARVEQGSGHRLLDDAALNAVRSLRSLPADAPRETLLPVRFRLD
jgi:protein TonB